MAEGKVSHLEGEVGFVDGLVKGNVFPRGSKERGYDGVVGIAEEFHLAADGHLAVAADHALDGNLSVVGFGLTDPVILAGAADRLGLVGIVGGVPCAAKREKGFELFQRCQTLGHRHAVITEVRGQLFIELLGRIETAVGVILFRGEKAAGRDLRLGVGIAGGGFVALGGSIVPLLLHQALALLVISLFQASLCIENALRFAEGVDRRVEITVAQLDHALGIIEIAAKGRVIQAADRLDHL